MSFKRRNTAALSPTGVTRNEAQTQFSLESMTFEGWGK